MSENGYNTQTEKKSASQFQEIHEQREKKVVAENKKLLAIIGHDIKTPMNSIVAFLDLIKEGVPNWDIKRIEKNINIALIAASKTSLLLDNLFQWAIANEDHIPFQPEPVDISELLNEEIENVDLFASQKQIDIIIPHFSNEIVFADKNMVKSILRNLLNNAIKYSHKFGKIIISSKRNNGLLEISIKDHGVGINSEKINSIFSSNNYISTLGTDNEPGTGFGLLLCKEFVDFHKGKIWLVSKPGEGSEFNFSLPISLQ